MATDIENDALEPFLAYFRYGRAEGQPLLPELLERRLEHATLMLSVAMAELTRSSVATDIEIDKAVAALVSLEETHPDLMDEFFYGQPTSVNWANHIIRYLSDEDASGSDSFVFQAAYLNLLLAAMSIRARASFEVKVPLFGGKLVLPTLGTIEVETANDSPDQLLTLSSNGTNLILWATGRLYLRTADYSESPPWQPLKRLTSPGVGLELVLDDQDPFRNMHPPAKWDEVGDLTRWQQLFEAAARLLADHDPHGLERVGRLLVSITPIQPINPGDERSSSNPHSPGGMALTEPTDALAMALLMLHETEHNLLCELLRVWQLEDERTLRHFAPWRDDPRPTLGVLHGVRAFTVQLLLWHALIQEPGPYQGSATVNLARWHGPTVQTAENLLARGRLPQAWKQFIGATVTALQALEFTIDQVVQSAADDLNLWNQTQWQLRNRCYDLPSIEAACAAFLAQQSPPAMSYVFRAQPVLPEERAQGRHLLQLLEQAAGVESSVPEPPRGAADALFAAGLYEKALAGYRQGINREPASRNHWAGFLLSLRHVTGSASDQQRAILEQHLPEVYAVHNQLREQGETPDLDQLITWWGS